MNKKILLIDDEVDFTEVVSTLLRFHDFDVEVFNDPIEVEPTLDKNNYDLIVTDLMMPHLSGFELIDLIQKKEKYKNVPIIVLSAKSMTDSERKTLLQAKTHCLTKPFDTRTLVDLICELVG